MENFRICPPQIANTLPRYDSERKPMNVRLAIKNSNIWNLSQYTRKVFILVKKHWNAIFALRNLLTQMPSNTIKPLILIQNLLNVFIVENCAMNLVVWKFMKEFIPMSNLLNVKCVTKNLISSLLVKLMKWFMTILHLINVKIVRKVLEPLPSWKTMKNLIWKSNPLNVIFVGRATSVLLA